MILSMDTTKEQAVALLNRFMNTPDPQVLLLNGTNQHAKHPLALRAALASGAKSILFRINSEQDALSAGCQRCTQGKRVFRVLIRSVEQEYLWVRRIHEPIQERNSLFFRRVHAKYHSLS